MPRGIKISKELKDQIDQMLREGRKTKEIRTSLNVAYSTIDTRKEVLGLKESKERKEKRKEERTFSLEDIMEAIIQTYERSKKVEELQERVNRLENQLAASRNELTITRERLDKYSKLGTRLNAVSKDALLTNGE